MALLRREGVGSGPLGGWWVVRGPAAMGQVRSLRQRVADLEAAAAEAALTPAPPPPPVDEAALLAVLGDQAAHILRTAHEAADAAVTRAEEKAGDLVGAADAEAN